MSGTIRGAHRGLSSAEAAALAQHLGVRDLAGKAVLRVDATPPSTAVALGLLLVGGLMVVAGRMAYSPGVAAEERAEGARLYGGALGGPAVWPSAGPGGPTPPGPAPGAPPIPPPDPLGPRGEAVSPPPPALARGLPPEPALGGFLVTHAASQRALVGAGVRLVVFLLLAAACAGLPHLRPPQPGEEGAVFAMAYLFAALCAGLGLAIFLGTLFRGGRDVHAFQGGLVLDDQERLEVMLFDQVARVRKFEQFLLLSLDQVLFYRFDRDTGESLELWLGQVADVEELGDWAQEQVFARLLPKVLAHLRAGGSLGWGPVTLGPTTLKLGYAEYPWSEIRDLPVARLGGVLQVETSAGSMRTGIHADAVPNRPLLARLPPHLAPAR